MFENNFNATEMEDTTRSGAQEGVVDPQESQTGGDDFAALDGREGFVDSQEGGKEDGSDAGEGSGGDRDPGGADQEGAQNRTREDNAAIRAARIRARREAEAEFGRKADEDIAASGVINPYTGKPFTSMKEFQDYGKKVREANIAEVAKKTGKSVEEVTAEENDREFLRKMRREAEQKTERQRAVDEQNAFIRNDVMDFVEKYPDVDLEKLENNPKFRKFCGSRFGKEPLAGLYEDFCDTVADASVAATQRQASRSARSTGGGNTGGGALTPSQKRDLDAWNRANPDMAMTAKEFLSRG